MIATSPLFVVEPERAQRADAVVMPMRIGDLAREVRAAVERLRADHGEDDL